MPHKRAKASIRLDRAKQQGHDLAPTAADSLLPIIRTQWDGSPLEGGDQPAGTAAAAGKASNKRRKKGGAGNGGGDDMAGASKSAFRVINAVKLREEYHAAKKRKLEDETKGKNPNQHKKPPAAMQPLPYESLGSFNRRVEQEMRGTVRSAIQQAGSTAQKRKDRKGKKKADGDEGAEGAEEGDEDVDEGPVKRGRDGQPLRKAPKPTPDEARDPFAKKPRAAATAAAGSDDDDDDADAGRNRSGRTEFETVSQRRRIGDVVQAPPTLADPARRGLMHKVLGPGGAAACGATSEGPGVVRLKGAGAGKGKSKGGVEAPVGSSRLPINPAMKALLDQERERAVRMYRELKEKREQAKGTTS
ncbi:hypothetical protein JCM8208_005626 [Rhodotorula glutinis]